MSYIIDQKIGNNIYCYEVQSYWDKDKKQPRQNRKYLGKKDNKTGKIIKRKDGNTPRMSRDYGNVYFLQKISERIGLTKILKESFPDDYNELLFISFYELCESKPLYLFNCWAELTYFKDTKYLNSQDISRLMKKIGSLDKQRQEFSSLWVKKHKTTTAIVFDITSLSSYSEFIELLEWGYNRDSEKLPQINLGVIFDQNKNLPLHYQIYPGSISDVSTLKNILNYLYLYKFQDVLFILDRGFYSALNLEEMSENGIKFILPMPFSVKVASTLLLKNKIRLKNPTNAFILEDDVLFHVKKQIKINNVDVAAHIYFNEKKSSEEKSRFLRKVLELEEKVITKNFHDKNAVTKYLSSFYKGSEKFFDINIKNNKTILSRKDKVITRYIDRMGNTIILTNSFAVDKKDILYFYKKKDYLEKMFDILKHELDGKRLRGHSKEVIEGRLFVKFITLILYSAISQVMREKKLFQKYSVKELIFELKKLRTVEMTDGKSFLTEVSKRQKDILKSFDLGVPVKT